MANIEEIWKPIRRYEKLYHVSNLGRVKRINKTTPERILKYSLNHKGYPIVTLSKKDIQKTKTIHRLVITHFIVKPKTREPLQSNHINGIKIDNRAVNLEWATASYNTQHAYDLGLIDTSLRKPRSEWQKRVKRVSLTQNNNKKRHYDIHNQLVKNDKPPKRSSNLPRRTD